MQFPFTTREEILSWETRYIDGQTSHFFDRGHHTTDCLRHKPFFGLHFDAPDNDTNNRYFSISGRNINATPPEKLVFLKIIP